MSRKSAEALVALGEKVRAYFDRRSGSQRRFENRTVDVERRAVQRRTGAERRCFATEDQLESIAQGRMTWEALHELAEGGSKWSAELISAVKALKPTAEPPQYLRELANGASKWAAELIGAVNSLKPAAQPASGIGKPVQQGAATLHDVLSARMGQIGEDAARYFQKWKTSSKAPETIELRGDVPTNPDSDDVIRDLYAVVKDINGVAAEDGVPATIAVTAGAGEVRDPDGNDVEAFETTIQTIQIRDGHGSAFDVPGVVFIERWKLGPKPGPNALTVTVGRLSKTFTATTNR